MPDAEQEQGGVVSPTLTSFMLYEFIFLSEPVCCMNSYIERIHLLTVIHLSLAVPMEITFMDIEDKY
jgi:hypothetical protein